MARRDDTPEAWQIDFPSQEAENHDEAEQEVIGFRRPSGSGRHDPG